MQMDVVSEGGAPFPGDHGRGMAVADHVGRGAGRAGSRREADSGLLDAPVLAA